MIITGSQLLAMLESLLGQPGRTNGAAERIAIASPFLDYLLAEPIGLASLNERALRYRLQQTYGSNSDEYQAQLNRLKALCGEFLQRFGDGPVKLLRAPARINILGEHVDYVSYLPTASLPFGSQEHDMVMLFRPSGAGVVRGASTLAEASVFSFALRQELATANPANLADAWSAYLYGQPVPAADWSNYVKGAVYWAQLKYGAEIKQGFDFVVDSQLPAGGGASSSSALTVLAGAAVREVNGLTYAPAELAHESAQAEWFVGTRGGAMDHLAICLAARSAAVHIAYATDQTELIPLPSADFCWVTFFSHPAHKSREVMLAYNERAAVSRLIIPGIIESWPQGRPELAQQWQSAWPEVAAGSATALNQLEQLMLELPASISLAEVARDFPAVWQECQQAFPALVQAGLDQPLQVRDRAQHHLGEVRRVAAAKKILTDTFRPGQAYQVETAKPAMRMLGTLLNESHASLRDLYEVSTPAVDQLIEIILAAPQVYGARLMGGGFGGNVLALTTKEQVASLIDRVQAEFYKPQQRHGRQEGAVMVSTPGPGLSSLTIDAVYREAVEIFNSLWWEAEHYQAAIGSLLDKLAEKTTEVWPIIVAAGKGSRAQASGLAVPKPLAPVAGVPALVRVLEAVKAAGVSNRPPVVIVSPETEAGARAALAGEEVSFVLQPAAKGTGDAVLCAQEVMADFRGLSLVSWGTQPVIRPHTIRRAVTLAALFADYSMIVPTTVVAKPYAPLVRDHRGRVQAARESHLERAPRPPLGETNIGMFVLRSAAMFAALRTLREQLWHEAEGRYNRPSGELGFPNELITYFAAQAPGVLAAPLADAREEQGIKTQQDVAQCERFLTELA